MMYRDCYYNHDLNYVFASNECVLIDEGYEASKLKTNRVVKLRISVCITHGVIKCLFSMCTVHFDISQPVSHYLQEATKPVLSVRTP